MPVGGEAIGKSRWLLGSASPTYSSSPPRSKSQRLPGGPKIMPLKVMPSKVRPKDVFSAGDQVVIHGLAKNPEYNGMDAEVIGRGQSAVHNAGSFDVRIDKNGEVLTIPPANIRLKKQMVHEGWLKKQGGLIRNWKRRWFTLEYDGTTVYYVDETKKSVKGRFKVSGDDVSISDHNEVAFGIQINTNQRKWFFGADTQEEFLIWKRKFIYVVQMTSGARHVNCTNPPNSKGDTCDWSGLQGELEGHIRVCGYVRIVCPFGCKMENLSRAELEVGHPSTCPEVQVPCKHCNVNYTRRSLPDHEATCTEQIEDCMFGCGARLAVSKMEAHLKDNVVHHLTLMKKQVDLKNRMLDECCRAINELKVANSDLEKIVQELKMDKQSRKDTVTTQKEETPTVDVRSKLLEAGASLV